MISIRDSDKQRLEEILEILSIEPEHYQIMVAHQKLQIVLKHINELMQPAPPIEPSIAPMSEADKRTCYPERFSK